MIEKSVCIWHTALQLWGKEKKQHQLSMLHSPCFDIPSRTPSYLPEHNPLLSRSTMHVLFVADAAVKSHQLTCTKFTQARKKVLFFFLSWKAVDLMLCKAQVCVTGTHNNSLWWIITHNYLQILEKKKTGLYWTETESKSPLSYLTQYDVYWEKFLREPQFNFSSEF